MARLGKFVTYSLLGLNVLTAAMLLLAGFSPLFPPERHPFISCLGFTFPAFLLLNLLFILGWLCSRRRKFIMTSTLALIVCLPQIRTYCPVNPHFSKIPDNSIKLLSYNVRALQEVDVDNHDDPLTRYLATSKADIICMQEYAYVTGRLEEKMDSTLAEYPFRDVRMTKDTVGMRLACFSRFPIVSARPVWGENSINGSVIYEIALWGDTLTLVNCHLQSNDIWYEDRMAYRALIEHPTPASIVSNASQLMHKFAKASARRAEQADSIYSAIARAKHPHAIVCGDFNDSSLSYTHYRLTRLLNDAYTRAGNGIGASYNRDKFYFRIDNILLSPSLRALRCAVDRSILASDHYPIFGIIAAR